MGHVWQQATTKFPKTISRHASATAYQPNMPNRTPGSAETAPVTVPADPAGPLPRGHRLFKERLLEKKISGSFLQRISWPTFFHYEIFFSYAKFVENKRLKKIINSSSRLGSFSKVLRNSVFLRITYFQQVSYLVFIVTISEARYCLLKCPSRSLAN